MIHITSKFRNTDSFPDLVTRDGSLKGSEYVRDLGVIIDKNLTFQQHIKNICKSASFGIFKIGKIRKLLDRPTTAKLTHAFVSSHLDYYNSIFFWPSSFIPTSTSKNTKYCCKACYSLEKIWAHNPNILHGQAPKYLSDLISLRCSSSLRPLRSSSTLQLTLGPRTVTRYGDRALSVIALYPLKQTTSAYS